MPLTGVEEAITRAVEKVSPSVVSITTVQIAHDDLLRAFPVSGMGSGLILVKEGYIATNYHVVGGSHEVHVILNDGRRFQAGLVGGDPNRDVAVVRIAGDGLTPATLGDSDRLKVGQTAIAIGSPFGLIYGGPTVTVGVVSALKRKIQTERGIIDELIQTDAPINPGNSGGPLVDSDGNVVGVNTAIIPFAQGIGFAVPINAIREEAEQLMKYGRIPRPWLGISGLTLTPQISDYYSLPLRTGILVVNVEHRSPADTAGGVA